MLFENSKLLLVDFFNSGLLRQPQIGVISKNDKINIVKKKVYEYLAAGVRVIWLIFPELKEVEVYTSPKNPQTLTDKEICSAAPVMEDFQLSVSDIFSE